MLIFTICSAAGFQTLYTCGCGLRPDDTVGLNRCTNSPEACQTRTLVKRPPSRRGDEPAERQDQQAWYSIPQEAVLASPTCCGHCCIKFYQAWLPSMNFHVFYHSIWFSVMCWRSSLRYALSNWFLLSDDIPSCPKGSYDGIVREIMAFALTLEQWWKSDRKTEKWEYMYSYSVWKGSAQI